MSISPVFERKARELEARDAAGGPMDRPVVLAVDDEPEITASLAELGGREYEVLTANSVDEALELLRERTVAVILTDQRMPDRTGSELLERSMDIAPDASRILFTGYSDISAVIDAINRGHVYHYLVKPWQPGELQAVLSRGLERHRLIVDNRRLVTELTRANEALVRANEELERRVKQRTARLRRQNVALREAQERIEVLSRTDSLTGVANRRWVDAVLELEVERSRRHGSPLSLVMADLDQFKNVNDTYGHVAGDKVLKATADILGDAVRATDLVGRYGGEEFLAILPNTGIAEAYVLAERIRVNLEKAPVAFRPEPVTMSLGVAEWVPADTVATLIHRADEALYDAKREGRNRVACRKAEG